MATDQRSLPAYFSVDADFQAWVQGLQAQFAACGLVRTADTGQINSSTVPKPAAASTSQGYEVYRFGDLAQASLPLFFKIEYGSGAVAADRPCIWITVGTGSSGAGVIGGGGANVARNAFYAAASKSAGVTLPSYCSGDGGRIALVVNYDASASTFGFGFVIDRLRDPRGQPSGEASMVFAFISNVWSIQVVTALWALATQQAAGTTPPYFPLPHATNTGIFIGGGQSKWGAQIAVLPLMCLLGQLRFVLAVGFYSTADVAASGVVQPNVNTLGALHTFLLLPTLNFNAVGDGLAILWE
jgi:hypothetical protein